MDKGHQTDKQSSRVHKGWIGVDLDGTLALYDGWQGAEHIGDVVPSMLEKVKAWTHAGIEVRIFTARASVPEYVPYVKAWLSDHGIGSLRVTNEKDFGMLQLWDDRCVQVIPNTGRVITSKLN